MLMCVCVCACVYVCVQQGVMISFRMFAEFVKRRDLEKIQTVLVERQYELDQTDDVCT